MTLDFPDKKVAWLLAVPISTEELHLVEKGGTELLEDLFEQQKINIFDILLQAISVNRNSQQSKGR